MHYSIKIPDVANRDNELAATKIKNLLFVMLEYGYTGLKDEGYEVKLDNDAVRRRKEYRKKRTEREAESAKAKK